jgi:hypothetical protein
MKILDIPKSGKCGRVVAFQSRYGLCLRELVIPRNTITPARQHMRDVFGSSSRMWGRGLSQEQRDRWNAAGGEVMSHPRLGQQGPLTGEQLFTGINSVLGCVHLPPLWEPPARVVFGLSPVRELMITHDEDGVRLFLRLASAPTEDIMVFGQAPCSAGRNKRRNVSYLGLLPPAVGGLSEITQLYRARFGEPQPGTKVFIVTCQQKNGWKGMDQESSEVVPSPLEGFRATAEPTIGQKPVMYKGRTRGAKGKSSPPAGSESEAAEAQTLGGKAAGAVTEGGGEHGGGGGSAG